MAEDAQFAYQANQIATATKEQLLLIVYDIALRSCRMAENALSKEKPCLEDKELAHKEIVRAQNAIRELMVTLNVEKGGKMAEALMGLYDYMLRLLIEANLRKDAKNLPTVISMLEELKETWESALVKLLEEYRAAHPDDEDFKAIKDIRKSLTQGLADPKASQPAAQQAAASASTSQGKPAAASAPAPAPKSGGLNIAG
ncbi:MAG: flagellar export chaperone FliS [Synergistaceae bacterium]|jgi:flagellar protein FliS|nr:flagellar export chaperone FliS [Synergistaceae bacterium]